MSWVLFVYASAESSNRYVENPGARAPLSGVRSFSMESGLGSCFVQQVALSLVFGQRFWQPIWVLTLVEEA